MQRDIAESCHELPHAARATVRCRDGEAPLSRPSPHLARTAPGRYSHPLRKTPQQTVTSEAANLCLIGCMNGAVIVLWFQESLEN